MTILSLARGGGSALRSDLGDGLGALSHRVLGELRGEQQADGRLDLSRAEGLALDRAGERRGLGRDAVELVNDEAVEDLHRGAGDGEVLVDLLQGAGNVDLEAALGLAAALAALLRAGRGRLLRALGTLGHCELVGKARSRKNFRSILKKLII